MTIFEIGDIVIESSGTYVGVVCKDNTNEGRCAWEVFWSDGDTTHYEDGESMSHHKAEPYQWTIRLIKKYMDIICP